MHFCENCFLKKAIHFCCQNMSTWIMGKIFVKPELKNDFETKTGSCDRQRRTKTVSK